MPRSSNTETKIFLYGPSGSGKSSVGYHLAKSLNKRFVDLDDKIVHQAGVTIPTIFKKEGEAGFREREKEALNDVLDQKIDVVALGGGSLINPENRVAVERMGEVILLSSNTDTLLLRLNADPLCRPLLEGNAEEKLNELLAQRSVHYRSFARFIDTTNQTVEQVSKQIQNDLGMFHVTGLEKVPSVGVHGSGYDVRVRSGSLDSIGDALSARGVKGRLILVSDDNVWVLYADRVLESLQDSGFEVNGFHFPAGEKYKTMETISSLWDAFILAGMDRGSTVLALGGGVVGDLAGFTAATIFRGISWVAVPTSLLAMVDASLGGKTGADLPQGKNLVGAFHPPLLVHVDPEVLETLPNEEFRSGMAEVVKHGVIGDPLLFDRCSIGMPAIKKNFAKLVKRGMSVKINIIKKDPYEKGVRASLNLGHTIGHAVEVVSGFRIRHGEAVAIGLVAEARLAENLGMADKGLADQIKGVLGELDLPTELPTDMGHESLVNVMGMDKKRAEGKIRFSLPEGIGSVKTGVEVKDILTVLNRLKRR